MGRAARIAKNAAKRSASAAGRGAAGFAKRAMREGYEAATRETCPHCGKRSDTSTLVCPGCGRNKDER